MEVHALELGQLRRPALRLAFVALALGEHGGLPHGGDGDFEVTEHRVENLPGGRAGVLLLHEPIQVRVRSPDHVVGLAQSLHLVSQRNGDDPALCMLVGEEKPLHEAIEAVRRAKEQLRLAFKGNIHEVKLPGYSSSRRSKDNAAEEDRIRGEIIEKLALRKV